MMGSLRRGSICREDIVMSKTTIRDIAEKAGVSLSAVSIAMNGKKGISEKTRARVLRTAQELGYHPPRHEAAEAGCVILLVQTPRCPQVRFVLAALAELSAEKQTEVRILTYAQVQKNPLLLSGCRLLITCDDRSAQELSELAAQVRQILILDPDYARKPFLNVRIDYAGAAYSLTKHLSGLGHRSFIYLNDSLGVSKNLQCFNGFQRLILETHMPLNPDQVFMNQPLTPGVWNALPDLIRRNNVSAIICTSGETAVQTVSQLENMGVHVPEDVSVAAVVEQSASGQTLPQLTSCSLDFPGFAQAVRTIAAAEQPDAQSRELLVPFAPVVSGKTTASPKFNPAKKKLAIVLYLKNHPTQRLVRAGFLNMIQQLGYQAEVVGIDGDSEEDYIRVCRELAMDEIAGVVLWLNIPKAVKYFNEANIPVVCLHGITKQTPSCGWEAGIAADPTKIADSVSSYFAAKLRGKKGFLSISQSGDNLIENSITEELIRLMERKCPEIQVAQDLMFAYHTEENLRLVSDYIEKTPDILGAYSTAGYAVMTWTKAAQLLGKKNMIIIGTDYSDETVQLLEAGEINAFVAQPVYEEAQRGVAALDAILRGHAFPYFSTLEAPLVTRQTVEKYKRLLQEVKNWYD